MRCAGTESQRYIVNASTEANEVVVQLPTFLGGRFRLPVHLCSGQGASCLLRHYSGSTQVFLLEGPRLRRRRHHQRQPLRCTSLSSPACALHSIAYTPKRTSPVGRGWILSMGSNLSRAPSWPPSSLRPMANERESRLPLRCETLE